MKNDETIIAEYSRAQAIADGALIDVSETAHEAGFAIPVAVTAAVWGLCVAVPEEVSGQDERGRLWDVLWMLHFAIRKYAGGNAIRFKLHVRNSDEGGEPPLVELQAQCVPGDNAEPVITVMLPDED